MKSIRTLISDFVYEHMEYLTDTAYRNDKIAGYPCNEDATGVTAGALIRGAIRMYLHERELGGSREQEYKERVIEFCRRVKKEDTMLTWGKLAILTGFRWLYEQNLLDIIPDEQLEVMKLKTDYTDFIDKETCTLHAGVATNYYHVATVCAGLREIIGFENEGMSDKFAEKMFEVLKENSETGWMDDWPPYGRFDLYTVSMNADICMGLADLGKPVPEFLTENLRKSAEIYYSMRNRKGEGFIYGRSISAYGETHVCEGLAFALKCGLIPKERKDEVICYCIHLMENLLSFWYKEDIHSFDLWMNGRKTQTYRAIHRILEANIDLCEKLFVTLECFEDAGLADYIPEEDLKEPEKWDAYETRFVEAKGKERAMFVLRRKDHTFMLPFVGLGYLMRDSAYYPFPAEAKFVQASTEVQHPFLTPEVILSDGSVAMPIEFIESVDAEYGDDNVKITAKGTLCKTNHYVDVDDLRADCKFTIVYLFEGNKISVSFSFDKEIAAAKMLFAGTNLDVVRFNGAEYEKTLDVSENSDFYTPHGPEEKCRIAFWNNGSIGYEIQL